MNKAKVLIIIDSVFLGGPGKGIFQILDNAPADQFDYILCNFQYNNQKSTEFIDSAREKGFILELLPQSFSFDPRPIFKVLKLISKENCTHIQTHGYKGHFIAFIVSRIKKIRWIAFTHGWTWQDFKVRIYQSLERVLLKYADIAVTVAPAMFEAVKGIRSNKKDTRLIFNAVEYPGSMQEPSDSLKEALSVDEKNNCNRVFLGGLAPRKVRVYLLKL